MCLQVAVLLECRAMMEVGHERADIKELVEEGNK
jgi:hypothetical protein